MPAFVLATAIALLFVRVSYDGRGSIYKTLARTTAAGLIAYLVLEPPSFTLADQAYAHVAAYVDIAYWVALILSTLGLGGRASPSARLLRDLHALRGG